ncbi:GreA/GreB family elongation factor [Actinophytocola algeriensis]|uniref:Transcription elongation GreA/GreB family factor n=1 Tax=Actinophytocola algeriensis TaxID=1768010 RepID=A0A7W7Q7L5_9PSEU|nr:GreA/GreB family elongation factor [Actinophytocola algeriensis]MBB4908525.1 transcription elongation GreA/GreB family factor [Actinophytocola algeriensis]MBE1475088.1 transcription elongation GreA/GreB family factor [Actinophytocola algeriensis]
MSGVWLTPQAHERLRAELSTLLAPGAVAEEPEAGRRRAARVREIRELLATAVVGEDPPNDGVAEPGMVLTVRYDDTGDEETFLLGLRDAEDNDLEVYSPASPLGTALTGTRRGEQRAYRVPNGATVRVTLLDAVPYGRHRASSAPAGS